MPEVSIIIPVYGVAEYVDAALSSVAAQTHADFEAIIVDDGSTDGSGDRARAFAAADPRFRVIAQANQGLGPARNAGLEAATGDWIAFLDGDDALEPTFLEQLLARARATGADWVSCDVAYILPEGDPLVRRAVPRGDARDLWPLRDWTEIVDHRPSAWNKIYARHLIGETRFHPGWFEDHAFFLSLAAKSEAIAHVAEPLVRHTRHRPGQITGSDDDRVFEQFAVLDGLRDIIGGTPKGDGAAAFRRLSGQLILDRLPALRQRTRREAFLATARTWLGDDLPAVANAVSPTGRALLEGLRPVSVIIPGSGDTDGLSATLASLEAQTFREVEVIVVADAGTPLPQSDVLDLRREAPAAPGFGAARDHGLARANGELVIILAPGDTLRHWVLTHWVDSMLASGADVGISAFEIGAPDSRRDDAGIRDGCAIPPDSGGFTPSPAFALATQPALSAKIFRRAHLADTVHAFGAAHLNGSVLAVAAMIAAERVVYFPERGVITDDAAHRGVASDTPPTSRQMVDAVTALLAADWKDRTPPQRWRGTLAARLVWDEATMPSRGGRWARGLFALDCGVRLRLAAGRAGTLDPNIGFPVRHLFK